MGYMIVRISNHANTRPFVAWTPDDTPIAEKMTAWLTVGETVEILDYQPDRDPRNDPFLIPDLNLWRDHLKEQDDDQHKQH